jgi:type IV pilus assembly protein PilO
MTVSGNYMQDDYVPVAEPAKVFGVPVPTFLGWLLGIGGVLGAGFILSQLVLPLNDEVSAVKADVEAGKERLAQKDQIEAELKQAKADLVKVNRQKDQVMALFAKEKDLNTVLLDLNQLIEKNNAGIDAARSAKVGNCPVPIQQQYTNTALRQAFEDQTFKGPMIAEAKLKTFKPDENGIQVLSDVSKDSYLKPALIGKLRRQTIDVSFEGNFNHVQSIFRAVERLQPLLIVKDLKVTRKTAGSSTGGDGLYIGNGQGRLEFLANCQPEAVTTATFKMDALLPLAPVVAEASKPAKAAADAATKATPSP